MGNSKIIKNYIYNTIYELLRLLIPLVTTPYVARVLGVEGNGIFDYAQSIVTYFVLIAAMGTSLYGQREIAYVQNDVQKRTKVFWEIVTFRFVMTLMCLSLYLFLFCFNGEHVVIYLILGIEIVSTAFDISWLYAGMEDFKVVVTRNIMIKLGGAILIFLLVKTPSDIPVYAFCIAVPAFVGNLCLWINVKKYLVQLKEFALFGIKKHLKPILILFIPQVAIDIYVVLDKTMLGFLTTDMSQVAFYSQAQKILKLVMTIITSLGTIMLPAMSAAYAQGKTELIVKRIETTTRYMLLMAFAFVFGISAVAGYFVPIYYGPGYDMVAILMVIMSPIIILIGMSNVVGKQYLLPTKQQSVYTLSVVTGAIINVVFNILLIPQYRAIGACVSTLISEFAVTSVQCLCVRKQLVFKKNFLYAIKYMVYGGIMFLMVKGIGMIMKPSVITLVLLIAVGVVVYVIMLLLTKDELLVDGIKMIRKRINDKETERN